MNFSKYSLKEIDFPKLQAPKTSQRCQIIDFPIIIQWYTSKKNVSFYSFFQHGKLFFPSCHYLCATKQ